jgi:hypothetical protein
VGIVGSAGSTQDSCRASRTLLGGVGPALPPCCGDAFLRSRS